MAVVFGTTDPTVDVVVDDGAVGGATGGAVDVVVDDCDSPPAAGPGVTSEASVAWSSPPPASATRTTVRTTARAPKRCKFIATTSANVDAV